MEWLLLVATDSQCTTDGFNFDVLVLEGYLYSSN